MYMRLKQLGVRDIDVVAHLRLAPEDEKFAGGPLGAVFRTLEECAHPHSQFAFAVVAQDSVVGFFVLREHPISPIWAPTDAITLHSFRIGQQYQGKGFARPTLDCVVGCVLACRPAAARLMLAVNIDNKKARSVYLSCGFKDTGGSHDGPLGRQNILCRRIA